MSLFAEKLKADPRFKQAKDLLLEALREQTQNIHALKAPQKESALSYLGFIEAYSKARGANLYFPYLGSGIGNGSFVELLDGSIKYDMITGIGVHFFGHSHPMLLESNLDAAIQDIVMQGNLQQNKESLDLADLLIKASGMPHCFFSTSGVMANENAVKIAFQKNFPASRILAFDHCFAGRSLTFSQVTDKPAFREGLPLNIQVDYIPFYDEKRPEESTQESIRELRKWITRYPKSHAIMIFELIQGEGGFYVGSKPFFEALMRICKEHHIAVFADEVQTFGRTERLFAYQHFGLESYIDLSAIGKLSQVAATFFTEEYKPKPGLLSQTFTGSTAALFACKKIVSHLLENPYYGLEGRMHTIHKRFKSHFEAFEKEYPNLISGPYGIGAMVAFTALDGSFEKTSLFVRKLFDAGVITFIAGQNPTRVRMLVPAAIITDEDIDNVSKIIKETLIHVSS